MSLEIGKLAGLPGLARSGRMELEMTHRRRYSSVLCLAAVLLIPRDVSAQDAADIAPAAREYLEHALRIMEAEALNRAKVDWARIRADAYGAAAGAQQPRDTYRAIAGALWALGDNHSRFMPPVSELPEELRQILAGGVPPEPTAWRVGERVGYVSVPAFAGAGAIEFARRIQDLIFEVDSPHVCGWIVDVRHNTGGNMWPMLQGLLSILGGGAPGYFVAADGTWTPWSIDTGLVGGRRLSRDPVAVALLQGNETASSGEAVAVAFRGRPGARSFGQPTQGLSTGNSTIELPDGARLILTTSVYADRNGNVYGAAIEPDEPIAADTPEEQVLDIASDWILRQPACS